MRKHGRMRTRVPTLRFRLVLDAHCALGPGKIDLLEAIEATGSITAAARAMRMSYKRAWQLIDDLNHCFATPLVSASKGGEHGGGAQLTQMGRSVLAAYRAIEHKVHKSLAAELRALARLRARS